MQELGVNWLPANTPFATATPIDALDIALLSWIIYRALLIIRGTRGQQSLQGLALLGGIYLASKLGGLTTMSWIFDNFANILFLALLIIFQEDIRRALARAGGLFFQTGGLASDVNQLEEVIRAVFALANRKIGALVAIEQSGSLRRYAEGAHTLDAAISAEIIQSVFHPTSPIHDGALVVSQNRIVAAGVFLPISLSQDISRTFGTRHRAAIGLTDETDAICLVASEERGTVALVQDGTVVPVADADDLRELLLQRIGERKQPIGGTP